jgi:hypothetical protein
MNAPWNLFSSQPGKDGKRKQLFGLKLALKSDLRQPMTSDAQRSFAVF